MLQKECFGARFLSHQRAQKQPKEAAPRIFACAFISTLAVRVRETETSTAQLSEAPRTEARAEHGSWRRGGAEAAVHHRRRDRPRALRHGAPLPLQLHGGGAGVEDHAQGAAAGPAGPGPRGAGAQAAPPRLLPALQPARGRAARRLRRRPRRPPRRRPLRRRGSPLAPLRPRRPPPRARGRRAGRAAGVRARRVPPPWGRAPRRQARQPALRRRHGRAQARRLRLRGVVRGRPAHVGPRRHAVLRGARGGGRQGVRGEGGRVERRGGALRDALRDRALLRRHRPGDLRGRAPRQPALPAARLRRRLARGQGPDAPHALQGRLPQALRRTSPEASVDRELRWKCGGGLKKSMNKHAARAPP